MQPEILFITPPKNFNIISVVSSMLLLSVGYILGVLFLVVYFFFLKISLSGIKIEA